MIPQIRFLFVGAPSRTSIETQKLLATNSLPIEGHFEASTQEALYHLHNCSRSHFPEVIMLDEQLGEEAIKKLLLTYRKLFYIRQSNSLIFIFGKPVSLMKKWDNDPLISGYIEKPFTKTLFLEQIYPLISITMI